MLRTNKAQCLGCLFIWSQLLGAMAQNSTESHKEGKIFSLFSIVAFKNTGCRSQSALPSGQSHVRNGTCYTASECTAKGGTAHGNCAAGYDNIENVTPISVLNSESAAFSSCNPLAVWLSKTALTSRTLGIPVPIQEPALSPTPFRSATQTTTGQSATTIPTICGLNTGQHIYVDMGNQATDKTTLTFAFTTTTTTRNWEIKVTQIECSNPSRPPTGCLQYFTTHTGRITTFNFLPTTTATSHLAKQDVTACIRRQEGFCCVQYQVCANVINGFSLSGTPSDKGIVDTVCNKDYLIIPGSSSLCSTTSNALNNKYCGAFLNPVSMAINVPICDCTSPFRIHFHSDDEPDGPMAPMAPIGPARGNCLDYQLLPCASK